MNFLLATLKFIAGFVSNLACQTARSLLNGSVCAFSAAACVVASTLALLRIIGGGKSKAHASASTAWEMAALSAKRGSVCVMQALGVVTLLSPAVRASQACSERMSPRGVFAPSGKGINPWQEIFGLNSWEDVGSESQHEEKAPSGRMQTEKSKAKKSVMRKVQDQARTPERPRVVGPKKENGKNDEASPRGDREWAKLVEEYLKATNVSDMDDIRTRMAIAFPRRYAAALDEATKKATGRSRAA